MGGAGSAVREFPFRLLSEFLSNAHQCSCLVWLQALSQDLEVPRAVCTNAGMDESNRERGHTPRLCESFIQEKLKHAQQVGGLVEMGVK